MNPPWFQFMVERLISSIQFSSFDFCDFPAVVIYASMTGCPSKNSAEVRKLLDFPPWMHEFRAWIPIVHVVIYDGLIVSQAPKDCSGPPGTFTGLFGLCFRTRRLDSAGSIDPAVVRSLFQFDVQLLSAPNFCGYLSQADLDAARSVLRNIESLARGQLAATGP
jgi:hypothetical protein